MICPNCGSEWDDNSIFCGTCGTKFEHRNVTNNNNNNNKIFIQKINKENVENILHKYGISNDCYIYSKTNSTFDTNNFDSKTHKCIINFNKNAIKIFLLSRINKKEISDIININANEIESIKLVNLLLFYNLIIKVKRDKYIFKIKKSPIGFSNQKENISKLQSYFINK